LEYQTWGQTYKLTADRVEEVITLAHRSGVLPVVEADAFPARDTAEVVDEPKEDAADNQGDLQERSDQLDLAIDADKEDVGQECEDCS
jgi:hypothetical protein